MDAAQMDAAQSASDPKRRRVHPTRSRRGRAKEPFPRRSRVACSIPFCRLNTASNPAQSGLPALVNHLQCYEINTEFQLSNKIHPTAIVSAQARLGENNIVGPHVVIENDVQIGNSNSLLNGVVLKNGVRIGNENAVHEHAVIGGTPQDLGFDSSTLSYVSIGHRNTLREYVTVNRASKAEAITRLGDGNYLMTQVHVAHDCLLGDRVVIAPGTGLGGFVQVADRAFVSGGVMVHQFVRIGTLAMIGGNAKITQDVLPYMITDGVPGTVRGLNLVGLRRADFSQSDLEILKKAYHLIHRSSRPLQEILDDLRAMDSPYALHLAEFIASSSRGFHREK